MKSVDINCDLGEEKGNDAEIIPFISSANIACGYHAGNPEVMEHTVELALQHGVAIGAHPGYPDREHFGRVSMDMTGEETVKLVMDQIILLKEITDRKNAVLHHVKLHGALYIETYRSYEFSKMIFKAIKKEYPGLMVYVAYNSMAEYTCRELGIPYKKEAFSDRMYNQDGSIVPRINKGAVIEDKDQVVRRSVQMIKSNRIRAYNGKYLNILFDTLCIHGDNANALEIAREIHSILKAENIEIRF
ncbi:MAG: 5-oxoprolinase subunit PxpA [Clostridia bacterium]